MKPESTPRRALGLLIFLILWVLASGLVLAQSQPPKLKPEASTQVEQHLFLDITGALDFESARAASYRPFSGLERLPMEGKSAWVRLTIFRPPNDLSPLYLRFLTPAFSEVRLFTPSAQEPGGWNMQNLEMGGAGSVIPIQNEMSSGQAYLQIKARFNSALVVFLGNQAEVLYNERLLDVAVTAITTLLGFFSLSIFWRFIGHHSWLSSSLFTLMVIIVTRVWITLGFAQTVFGISQEVLADVFALMIIASTLNVGVIFLLLATEIFQGTPWFRWLWGWVAIAFGVLIFAFFDLGTAIRISDGLMLVGAIAFIGNLLFAAKRSPEYLQIFAAKVAFLTLILISGVMLFISLQFWGWPASASALQQPELVMKTIVIRSILPLVVLSIASWSFGRLRDIRLGSLKADLISSQVRLELESKRLERQRKFTAMLAHELKNPLTASHMALFGIEEHLDSDNPMYNRAKKIKTSLLEINAIIDRCSEVDGYEQGQWPMRIDSFPLSSLLTEIQVANQAERIYMVTRGLDFESLLTSDRHYIKIIINNLLANALKYSPPETLVELAIRNKSEGKAHWVEFTVANDIGPAGLPEPDRLYQRFYRSEAARNHSGAGLGLWLSQSLAQALSSDLVYTADDQKVYFSFSLRFA